MCVIGVDEQGKLSASEYDAFGTVINQSAYNVGTDTARGCLNLAGTEFIVNDLVDSVYISN
jgi:hypothetical protein